MPEKRLPQTRICKHVLCRRKFIVTDWRQLYCKRSHAKASWAYHKRRRISWVVERPTSPYIGPVLRLHKEGFGQAEISRRLGITKGTVCGLVFRWGKPVPNTLERLEVLHNTMNMVLEGYL